MAPRRVVAKFQIFVCLTIFTTRHETVGERSLSDMDRTTQSHTSATALVTFLNSHSSDGFKQKDVQWLFQIPRVAQVLNRVVPLTLTGHECVLEVDELKM